MPNVLSHLVRDENSMTNLLKSLCVLKPIREVVVRLFTAGKFGADDVGFDDISTQQNIGGSIPDMCIKINALAIAVEIKTSDWRGLTDNQPTAYLEWLNGQTGDKFFVFLVTPSYLAQHRQEYDRRKDKFIAIYPGHGITFIEINWLDLCSKLQETELSSSCVYTRDFENLIRDRYLPTPIHFTIAELKEKTMFNTTAASSITKIFQLVGEIALALEKEGLTVTRRFKNQFFADNGEYAIYVCCGDKQVLWLGIWGPLWREHGWPLAIGVDNNYSSPLMLERFKTNFPGCIVYSPKGGDPYLVKKINEDWLREDAVRDVLCKLEPYLNGICDIVKSDQPPTQSGES